MKVLFAVSTENVVDSIIKVYQKEYKEIISSKNVYYFNAIIKELQRNQNYDRIIISEDLEPFTNNNYDAIDKFIFEKLDNISDEAIDSQGRDIPIIVICSERREKSDDLLVKLFSMGIYDALVGQDRKIEDVCRLLNKPRTKKEAKTYYKIEQGEYEHEDENNVSEVEIQNILSHFRKILKNESKYVESFDSIAEQYNDEQLKIITKFLPIEVKAVLEAESPKYQSIMMYRVGDMQKNLSDKKKLEKSNIKIEKILDRSGKKMSGPVIIPSAIKKSEVKKIKISDDVEEKDEGFIRKQRIEQPEQIEDKEELEVENDEEINEIENTEIVNTQVEEPEDIEIEKEDTNEIEEKAEEPVKRKRGRPRKNPVVEELENKPKRKRGRPRKNPLPEEENLVGYEEEDDENTENLLNLSNDMEDNPSDIEDALPGFENDEDELPGLDLEEDDELPGTEADEEKKENDLSSFDIDVDEKDDDIESLSIETEEFNDEYDDNKYSNRNISNNVNREFDGERLYRDKNGSRNMNMELEHSREREEPKVDISYLLTQDKKLFSFIGTSKNGVSFLANNMAFILSERGINTALVDLTRNKNSYYIYTQNKEELREIAYNSMESLKNGEPNGIQVSRNLTVFTSSPNIRNSNYSIEKMLTTLAKNFSLVILDCDYTTSKEYFRASQEIYLVQSMDVLTIQPLTEFLRKLKLNEILDERKLRAIINKAQKVKNLSENMVIGGMSTYNDPEMSIQDRLFDMKTIQTTIIPFDMDAYQSYLSQIANCEVSTRGYNKSFLSCLNKLADQVYPVVYGKRTSNKNYNNYNYNNNNNYNNYNRTNGKFSNNVKDTLNKMKQQYK